MTSNETMPTIVNAAAAEAVRALNHLTLGRLAQLLRQPRGWLDTAHHEGQLRSDNTTDSARIVDQATAELGEAGQAAHHLAHALDDAHQLLAQLAATEPGRTHQQRGQPRPASPASQARAHGRPGNHGGQWSGR